MINYSTSPWLRGDLSAWGRVTEGIAARSYEKNRAVFTQDAPFENVCIVKKGRIILSAFSCGGIEKIIMFAAAGGLFSEQCLVRDSRTPYTATAITDSEIYLIPREKFLHALRTDASLAESFTASMIARERLLIAEIADLAFVDVFHRIVTELLYCANLHGERVAAGIRICIPITQQDMGNRVQATRLTVSKALHRLIGEGIIRKDGLYYTVTSLDRLKAYNDE